MATKPGIRVLVSNTHNPFLNLATEEWLFRSGDISVNTLYLWRNEPTIVIGRCQNPWKEVNVQKMEADGVHLARRFSGGGTVYQDLGNTCFTFLSSMENYNKERNSGIIIKALEKFGISANTSGRNDIEVDGHKVSGAAYKLAPPRALHHGTLLINVEMTALSALLNPNKLKLQSKGVASVTARVSNLKTLNPDISHDSLTAAVIESFCDFYGSPTLEPELLDEKELEKLSNGAIQKVYGEMRDDKWRYGETPAFSHHLESRFESPSPWGTIDVHIDSHKGKINEAKVFSDSLYPNLIDALAKALSSGVMYDPKGVDQAMAVLLADAKDAVPDLDAHVADLGKWLKTAL